jgi:1,4-alpha-glucan branching enzyme
MEPARPKARVDPEGQPVGPAGAASSLRTPARAMRWRPRLGAWLDGGRPHFRVWAPDATRVALVVHGREAQDLRRDDRGYWSGSADCGAGARYMYRLDGRDLPDPASRFQPHGVHGPSEVIDPTQFAWSDAAWEGVPLRDLVIYELHIGTFTRAGTYAGARQRLGELRQLGVTALELMPVAESAGGRNWGYDGVDLFAPYAPTGVPTTCVPSSTPRTPSGSPCCSTSSTTTSGPRARISRHTRPSTSARGTTVPGARR